MTTQSTEKAADRLANDLDLLHRNRSPGRDLVGTPHPLGQRVPARLVEILRDGKSSDEHVDPRHFRKQQAGMEQGRVGRAGGVVRMQRTSPHLCPVGRHTGHERLPIHEYVKEIALRLAVEAGAEPVRGRRAGRTQVRFGGFAVRAEGEFQIRITNVNPKNIHIDLL